VADETLGVPAPGGEAKDEVSQVEDDYTVKTEQAHQFGPMFYITVAISAAFVVAGVLFTEPFGSALAAILLLAGGLDALQNGAILAATPFGILMLVMCWCLYKALVRDYREERRIQQEIMGYDREVERRQQDEIMRRLTADQPVPTGQQRASNPNE
jgi:choline-glycine betaine transporter